MIFLKPLLLFVFINFSLLRFQLSFLHFPPAYKAINIICQKRNKTNNHRKIRNVLKHCQNPQNIPTGKFRPPKKFRADYNNFIKDLHFAALPGKRCKAISPKKISTHLLIFKDLMMSNECSKHLCPMAVLFFYIVPLYSQNVKTNFFKQA